MSSLRELRAARSALQTEAKSILDSAEDFSDERKARVDAIFAELDQLDRKLELAERSAPRSGAAPAENTMIFRDRETGTEVRSLGKGESFASRTPDVDGLRFGHVLKAVFTGDREGLTDAEKRAASEGSSTAGGYVVPAPISARVYDLIRAKSSVMRAGPTIVPMASRTLDLVKVTTGPTTGWLAENAQGSSADIVLGRVQLAAKMLACYAEASIELVQDSDPSFSTVLENSIASAMAVELDRVFLDGTGSSNQPLGILRDGSVPNLSFVPSPVSYLRISQVLTTVLGNNITPNNVIITSRDLGGCDRLTDTTGQPILPTSLCAQYMPFIVSNQRSAESGSPQDSKLVAGDFSYFVAGIRQQLMLETSNVATIGSDSAWDKRQIHFRATLRADCAVVLGNAFCTADFGAPA